MSPVFCIENRHIGTAVPVKINEIVVIATVLKLSRPETQKLTVRVVRGHRLQHFSSVALDVITWSLYWKKNYLADITLPTITFGRVHLIGREHWSKLFFGGTLGYWACFLSFTRYKVLGMPMGFTPRHAKTTTQFNAETCFLFAHWKPALNMLKIKRDSNQQYFKIVNLHLSNLNNFNHLKLWIKFSVILRNRNKPQTLLNEK